MAWNPFSDILSGIQNAASGVGSWLGNGIGGFFDMFESGASRRQEARSDKELLMSYDALQHQKSQDAWANQFAENQAAFQQQAYQQNYDLARSPISTLVKDGASVGINPMAAIGQNVGSASYSSASAQNSSVTSPSTPNTSASQNLLGGLSSILGSLMGTKMTTQTSKDVAEIQADTAKEVAEEQIQSNEKIAEMEDSFKRDELENTKNFQQHQVAKMNVESEVALRGMNTKEGELELEKQKRLDKLFQDLSERSQREQGLRIQFEQLQHQKKELERAISSDNKQLAAKIFGGLCIVAGSILGGPVGAVAGTAVANYINSGNSIGFKVKD